MYLFFDLNIVPEVEKQVPKETTEETKENAEPHNEIGPKMIAYLLLLCMFVQ